ncbi:hypothetical protein [Enterobacter asburiae]|uniref:hypothetical protein n=1 Tax=Enterobacter asburiae TaxID=61645 RepID=UPI003C12F905
MKENRIIAEQRDRAVKEKRWISEKREVTAMATASAAVRAKNKLAERIGKEKLCRHYPGREEARAEIQMAAAPQVVQGE